MEAGKLISTIVLVVIPIAALLLFIFLSKSSSTAKCFENITGSKTDIKDYLTLCASNCWSKHDYGKEPNSVDCYSITVNSREKITNKDIESISKNFNVKSYLNFDLNENTFYKIKLRYDYSKQEISVINEGYCGNNIVEGTEFCDGDATVCQANNFGTCTGNTLCNECICETQIDCSLCQPPTTSNPSNSDWCKYCKSTVEFSCSDGIDNDCNGLIDNNDNFCKQQSQITLNSCKKGGDMTCPYNPCMINREKNGVPYPPCPNNVKNSNTNPADIDSCDSTICMYESIHNPSSNYLNVYDTQTWNDLKSEIESQLQTIDFVGMKITVNKRLVSKFAEVESKLNKYPHSGRTYYFPSGTYTFVNGGSYNFRYNVNNPTVLSPHSFGLAIDLNVNTNWGNVNDPDPCNNPSCIIDIPPEVVEAFESSGFRWGGRYWCSFDPMHFEYIETCR
ncbi:MAG: M15 family metallopeptidase [Candidatus Aenigmatarchaeota archaeon]|nr:M15 family metallopeptidase [Candidatus Aenigmarchaeota archaeon]